MGVGENPWYQSVTSFQQNFNSNKPFIEDDQKYQLDSNSSSSNMQQSSSLTKKVKKKLDDTSSQYIEEESSSTFIKN
jgi:hypothetical protein